MRLPLNEPILAVVEFTDKVLKALVISGESHSWPMTCICVRFVLRFSVALEKRA